MRRPPRSARDRHRRLINIHAGRQIRWSDERHRARRTGRLPELLLPPGAPRPTLDDSLDVVEQYGVGGTFGALLTGIFAQKAMNGVAGRSAAGNPGQVVTQVVAVLCALVYSAVVSFILLKVVGLAFPLKASDDEQSVGLDVAAHGEEACTPAVRNRRWPEAIRARWGSASPSPRLPCTTRIRIAETGGRHGNDGVPCPLSERGYLWSGGVVGRELRAAARARQAKRCRCQPTLRPRRSTTRRPGSSRTPQRGLPLAQCTNTGWFAVSPTAAMNLSTKSPGLATKPLTGRW